MKLNKRGAFVYFDFMFCVYLCLFVCLSACLPFCLSTCLFVKGFADESDTLAPSLELLLVRTCMLAHACKPGRSRKHLSKLQPVCAASQRGCVSQRPRSQSNVVCGVLCHHCRRVHQTRHSRVLRKKRISGSQLRDDCP